jgi:predicted PurR-regulated permease PerM
MASLLDLVPPRHRALVLERVGEVDFVLGQFVRGQLLVMLLLAIAYGVGFSMVSVPLAVPIGIVAGALSFIPYVGGAIALVLSVMMSLLHGASFGQLLAVISVYAVVQLLEGFVITPRVVGEKLGLSPLSVLFALMAGGELFGFLGVMAALPVAAVLKVILGRGVLRYRTSALYVPREKSEPSEPGESLGKSDPARGGPSHPPAQRLPGSLPPVAVASQRAPRPIRFRAPYLVRARGRARKAAS